ncbi:MAG TPA: GNAT family N-acetyltransferase [Candidatus Eisenbacteria bacterium]|nr:GNAT family N-acetyltransferase [Candidatus Eisenbacteria bacterium]
MSAAPFAVRAATPSDAEAIHRCLRNAFEPYRPRYTPGAFGDTVPTPEGIRERVRTMAVFVAHASNEIVGTIGGHETGDGAGHIRGMAVLPEWQGLGVAAALLAEVERALRSMGCRRVNLHTTRPLLRAARFYEKEGYLRTGAVEDFFGMDIIEFAKNLE